MKNEKIQKIADKLISILESGDFPKMAAASIIAGKGYPKPSNKWSLGNLLLMFSAGTSDARTFKQWQSIGRYPMGKANLAILGPMLRIRKEKDERTGEETLSQRLFGFRAIAVFAIENTDGTPVEKGDFEPPELPNLFSLCQKWGIQVEYIPKYENGYLGFYQQSRQRIVLCSHEESIFFHELAHAAHGKIDGSLREIPKWEKEIIAEMSAMILARFFGKNLSGDHFEYVTQYSKMAKIEPHEAALKVLSKIGKVIDLILEAGEEKPIVTATC